jgi:proteasome alpha subunit
MTEEPYRWLEAIANRREYVRDQLKGGTPVFAASLPDGILLLGVGSGQSKVFELFDRQAMAGLGHPADIERIRHGIIDAAHMEAFTRAPEDVSLRRLVGFGLGAQLKTNFEQVYSAPFLAEMILAEIGSAPAQDVLVRVHFDGTFHIESGGLIVAAALPETERAAQTWLQGEMKVVKERNEAAERLLQAWWISVEGKSFTENVPPEEARRDGWRKAVQGRIVELGWLARAPVRPARYESMTLDQLGL